MSPKIILTYGIAWLLWTTCADAQTVRKHVLQRNEPATAASHRKKPAKRPVYQLDPTSSAARGLLVLLPGRGEPAEDVFRATNLAQQAAQHGFVVLVPELNDRRYLDTASTHFLDDAIREAVQQHPTLAHQLIMGGFSAGGQLALAYAEQVVRDSAQRPWRVRAILGVDPPLDLADHWQRAEYHLAKQDCAASRISDQNTLRELTRDMGGSPAKFPEVYLARTAFSRSDPAGGNAQWLRRLPIRLYCEPDLAFWQKDCPTLEPADFNADGAAALIACLQRQGNTQAQYIKTTGKGFIGKRRMPHSWSIVDATECADWLQHCLK
jgi:pimeloyl-ACP methyl ester carboxylesterase